MAEDEETWRDISPRTYARARGKRFVVHGDEKLTAFVELESAIRAGERLAASP
jgi:hypothetical protein